MKDPGDGEIVLRAPPTIPDTGRSNTLLSALPAMGGLGSVAYMFAGPPQPATYVAGTMFLLLSLAMVAGNVSHARGSRNVTLAHRRRTFQIYLVEQRTRVRDASRAQRDLASQRFPDPHALWTIATSARVWERVGRDEDFPVVRVGTSTQSLLPSLRIESSESDAQPDAFCEGQLKRFMRVHSQVLKMPHGISLRELRTVNLTGPPARCRGLVRAVIGHACTFHSPNDLAVFIYTGDLAEWQWAKWLPHARGHVNLDNATLQKCLSRSESTPGRHVLVVIDTDADLEALDGTEGTSTTVFDLSGRTNASDLIIRLTCNDSIGIVERSGHPDVSVAADSISIVEADALARCLAGRHGGSPDAHHRAGIATSRSLLDLLQITDISEIDVAALRRTTNSPGERLRLPLGTTTHGEDLMLDIKEAAQGGVGPHGLIVGATGSGKSELLRTMVLGAAVTHPTETLNFILVDFKGGATFAGLSSLPHVSALITNLQDDATLVDRMRDALTSELNRRQNLLRKAGNAATVGDYERVRRDHPQLPPLASLLIVVDEFTELLAQQPDFIDLFVQIGRLGRSLGIHLLLATQRLDEGRVRGLESHLSYRIALRTFSAAESRTAIGVPDASELPGTPGHAYLRTDNASLVRFRAAYASGPLMPRPSSPHPTPSEPLVIHRFNVTDPPDLTEIPAVQEKPSTSAGPGPAQQTSLSALVQAISPHGQSAHRIWLPPLDVADPLDAMHLDLAVRPGRGFGTAPDGRALAVPIATVDEPLLQRRSRLAIDVSRAGAHVAVVGGPRSGKSTLLRTILMSLALRHTPDEVQFYCLDFSDGSLSSLGPLPHTGSVTNRRDAGAVRRTISQLLDVIAGREATQPDEYGDVFVAIDGFAAFSQEFDDLLPSVRVLAERGAAYGIHLVLTAYRWTDFRQGLRDLIGTRLELKLGDSLDSDIDRRLQTSIPIGRPGRGITPDGSHFLSAVPRADGRRGIAGIAGPERDLVRRIAEAWDGAKAPRIRSLPTSVSLADLAADVPRDLICLGLEGRGLSPLTHDPSSDLGAIAFGDPGSGKTMLLRSIGQQVQQNFAAPAAKLVVIDYRRHLLGEFGGEGLLDYAATKERTAQVIAGLCDGFASRMPGEDVTAEQLRARSWWTGPQIYLLVDDYELVASTSGNPLLPLLAFLPHARDVGLRLFITRRAAGTSRALLDPLLGQVIELQLPGIVLSAPPDEGRILGVPAAREIPGRGTYIDRLRGRVAVQLARARPSANE